MVELEISNSTMSPNSILDNENEERPEWEWLKK